MTGPHRTLMQDPVFAIDQLVEIAIRALSPAVNDTFTALTCIDWLTAGLSRVSGRTLVEAVYRDRFGRVRLIEHDPSYARMVNRAFDEVRQAASGGLPAVILRLTDSLTSIRTRLAPSACSPPRNSRDPSTHSLLLRTVTISPVTASTRQRIRQRSRTSSGGPSSGTQEPKPRVDGEDVKAVLRRAPSTRAKPQRRGPE